MKINEDKHRSQKQNTQIFFNKSIKFNDVSFKYDNEKDYVFEKINFTIKKGQKIGIIGVTGSGKSTMVDLLSGLLKPTNGKILIDNLDLNSNNLLSWQQKISHVPQVIFLKDGTIRENIAIGYDNIDIDQNKILNSINVSCLDKAINLFPKELYTIVGDNGTKLSGGQRQRIGIARAIYNLRADVLILDEATSSLDKKTEKQIIKNVMKLDGNITLFMISHNHESLRYCDKIYELKIKKLNYCGTFDDISDG